MFRRILIAAALVAPSTATRIQCQELHVSGEKIRAHVKYLAGDELEGRGVGTRGETLATEYIASQLKVEGVTPGR